MKTINLLKKLSFVIAMIGICQFANAQTEIFKETFTNVSGNLTNAGDKVNFDSDADNLGWTGTKYYGAGGCIRIGASSDLGSVTTPTINLSDPTATYTLTFNACAWKNDKTSFNIVLDGQEPITVDGLTNSGDYATELYAKTYSVELKNGTAASKITFKAIQKSDARFFLDNIIITKTGGSGVVLEDPQVAFSTETATYTLGEAFSAPKFTTVSDGEVTYKSSNTNVATVDAEGNVTAVAAGTTIITASIAATDTYAAGYASYTLTVVDPNILLSEDFANGLNNFTRTGDVWKTGKFNGQPYAQANANKKGAKTDMLVSPIIDLSEANNAILTFDHATGYIGNNDPKVDFTLWVKEESASDWTQLSIPTYPESGSSWSAFVSSGDISLQAYCGKKVQIAFQYKSTEEKQSGWEVTNILVRKAEPATVTIPVSGAGYATYFSNQAWTVADNMKAGIITGVENNSVKIDWLYEAGSVVPANTAVLIQAAASDYVCEISNDATAAPAENLLKGSATEATTEGENCLFYKLSYDNNGENLGFYWAAENGAAFTNGANKAYLALPVNIARNVRGFGIGNDGTTGIQQIESGDALVNVYSIDGTIVRKQVKESEAVQGLKKGIYIINGKKIIK